MGLLKNKFIKWPIKGLVFAVFNLLAGLGLLFLFGVIAAIGGEIIAVILLLPLIYASLTVSGFLIEWVNKVIK